MSLRQKVNPDAHLGATAETPPATKSSSGTTSHITQADSNTMTDDLRQGLLTDRPVRVTLDEAPPAAPVPAVASTAAQVGITQDQLLEAMRILGRELRQPDDETLTKKAEERARLAKLKAQERIILTEQAEAIARFQKACADRGHRQNGGQSQNSAISGQVCSDGKYHWLCVSCQATGVRELSAQERGGMGLSG